MQLLQAFGRIAGNKEEIRVLALLDRSKIFFLAEILRHVIRSTPEDFGRCHADLLEQLELTVVSK